MATLLAESERLLPLWDDIYERTATLRQSSYSSFSEEEQRYFDLLSRYVDAVRFTVVALVDRQRFMDEGTKAAFWCTVAWEAKIRLHGNSSELRAEACAETWLPRLEPVHFPKGIFSAIQMPYKMFRSKGTRFRLHLAS